MGAALRCGPCARKTPAGDPFHSVRRARLNVVRNKHVAVYKTMRLKPKDVDRIYAVFYNIDIGEYGTKKGKSDDEINLAEFLRYFDLERTPLVERLFSFMDIDMSGQIDFKEFLMTTWDFLSLDHTSLQSYAFNLYDRDDSQKIDVKELHTLFAEVYGVGKLRKNKSRRLELFDWTEYEEAEEHRRRYVKRDWWLEFLHRFPALMWPVVELQRRLRQGIVGESFWKRQEHRRDFGGIPANYFAMLRQRRTVELHGQGSGEGGEMTDFDKLMQSLNEPKSTGGDGDGDDGGHSGGGSGAGPAVNPQDAGGGVTTTATVAVSGRAVGIGSVGAAVMKPPPAAGGGPIGADVPDDEIDYSKYVGESTFGGEAAAKAEAEAKEDPMAKLEREIYTPDLIARIEGRPPPGRPVVRPVAPAYDQIVLPREVEERAYYESLFGKKAKELYEGKAPAPPPSAELVAAAMAKRKSRHMLSRKDSGRGEVGEPDTGAEITAAFSAAEFRRRAAKAKGGDSGDGGAENGEGGGGERRKNVRSKFGAADMRVRRARNRRQVGPAIAGGGGGDGEGTAHDGATTGRTGAGGGMAAVAIGRAAASATGKSMWTGSLLAGALSRAGADDGSSIAEEADGDTSRKKRRHKHKHRRKRTSDAGADASIHGGEDDGEEGRRSSTRSKSHRQKHRDRPPPMPGHDSGRAPPPAHVAELALPPAHEPDSISVDSEADVRVPKPHRSSGRAPPAGPPPAAALGPTTARSPGSASSLNEGQLADAASEAGRVEYVPPRAARRPPRSLAGSRPATAGPAQARTSDHRSAPASDPPSAAHDSQDASSVVGRKRPQTAGPTRHGASRPTTAGAERPRSGSVSRPPPGSTRLPRPQTAGRSRRSGPMAGGRQSSNKRMIVSNKDRKAFWDAAHAMAGGGGGGGGRGGGGGGGADAKIAAGAAATAWKRKVVGRVELANPDWMQNYEKNLLEKSNPDKSVPVDMGDAAPDTRPMSELTRTYVGGLYNPDRVGALIGSGE